jgi:hypothetical protein
LLIGIDDTRTVIDELAPDNALANARKIDRIDSRTKRRDSKRRNSRHNKIRTKPIPHLSFLLF